MITKKNVEVTITDGTPPYSYTWSADDTCATFSKESDTTTANSYKTDITFQDNACLTGTTITTTVTDAKGCKDTLIVPITDICDSSLSGLSSISESSTLTFTANAYAAGCSSMDTFTWDYDDIIFNELSVINTSFTSTLQLDINSGFTSFPNTTSIKLTAVDCNGCTNTVTYSYSFCKPIAVNLSTTAYQEESLDFLYRSKKTTIPPPTACPASSVDWTTLSFELPPGISVTTSNTSSSLVGGQIIVSGDSSLSPGLYAIRYTVRNDDGILSTKGVISVTLVGADVGTTLIVSNKTVDIGCDLTSGETLSINIEDEIVPVDDAVVDWSTWQLVTPPVSLSSSITLTTNTSGDHIIEYVLPNPVSNDSFAWSICDTDGNCAESAIYTLVDCKDAPIAGDDTASVACGETVVISILDNDSGVSAPLVNSSIVITSNPTDGTVTKVGDGTVTYTADAGFSGADTFKYTVNNTNGSTSNEATVTITVSCAGEDASVSICN